MEADEVTKCKKCDGFDKGLTTKAECIALGRQHWCCKNGRTFKECKSEYMQNKAQYVVKKYGEDVLDDSGKKLLDLCKLFLKQAGTIKRWQEIH